VSGVSFTAAVPPAALFNEAQRPRHRCGSSTCSRRSVAETTGPPKRAGPTTALSTIRRPNVNRSTSAEDNFAWYLGAGEELLTIPGVNRASTCAGSGPDYAYAGHPLSHPLARCSDCCGGVRAATCSLRSCSERGGVAVRRRQRGLWQCHARAPRRPALRCGAVCDGFCCGTFRNGFFRQGPLYDGSFCKGRCRGFFHSGLCGGSWGGGTFRNGFFH